MTVQAREAMIVGAKSMALTGYEVLVNKDLLLQIKEEFSLRKEFKI
jgi:hypothetical protein